MQGLTQSVNGNPHWRGNGVEGKPRPRPRTSFRETCIRSHLSLYACRSSDGEYDDQSPYTYVGQFVIPMCVKLIEMANYFH